MVSPKKVHVQKHETLDCRKLHKQLNGILWKSFWLGMGIYFLIDI
jgi:hypothetical protein